MPPDLAKVTAPADQARADAVVVLSFGTGAANQALAGIAAGYSRAYHLPLICQTEIAEYLRREDYTGQVLVIPQSSSSYMDTSHVLAAAKSAFCGPHGWNEIILVAHPDHMLRATGAAEKLEFRVIAAKVENVPYDRESTQWRTRTKFWFGVWNAMATLYYRATGRM